jgi:hypothetical protein
VMMARIEKGRETEMQREDRAASVLPVLFRVWVCNRQSRRGNAVLWPIHGLAVLSSLTYTKRNDQAVELVVLFDRHESQLRSLLTFLPCMHFEYFVIYSAMNAFFYLVQGRQFSVTLYRRSRSACHPEGLVYYYRGMYGRVRSLCSFAPICAIGHIKNIPFLPVPFPESRHRLSTSFCQV